MGRRSHSGGVRVVGSHGIEFTFWLNGQRYRPTVSRVPNELNLRGARQDPAAIKGRIANHRFVLHDEFPEYRFKPRRDSSEPPAARADAITCDQMFDAFLAHCQMRVEMKDLARSTLIDYRRILERVWSPPHRAAAHRAGALLELGGGGPRAHEKQENI
jgi:hypothetical protein